MHDQSNQRKGSPRRPSVTSNSEQRCLHESQRQDKEEMFKVQQSPFLLNGENTESYFMGTSSVRTFLDAFKCKLQESGLPCSDLNADVFFHAATKSPINAIDEGQFWTAPPRLLSDQMVNIFFQEWAPLFPVLHRPSFLSVYEQHVSNSNQLQDKKSLAQLNLVFSIAALSNDVHASQIVESCENQWMAAMETFQMETSLTNLQCLVLAQLYCAQKGDASRLLHYKGLAVSLSQRLGLHLSQKRFALGALTVETRKKVFWTMYTLDCFSAAFLGLPKLLNEEDIHCEYPVDYDDEYVTEKGFLPMLPGEFTKLSSALALFRGTRILAKVLATNYPAATSHELSLRSIAALDEELQEWSDELPSHLKLEFVQDKPSTRVISSRCPLLSLTYNYIRTLIHRPAVCANLADKASSSKVALASAHKKIIQIIQLLDERNLSFSHCLNKNEMLLLSGIGFLFQSLDLDRDGKLMQDSQRLTCTVIDKLERRNAPGASEFKQLGCAMLSIGRVSPLLGKTSPKSGTSSVKPPTSETPRQKGATNSREQLADMASEGQRKNRSSKGPSSSISASMSPDNSGNRRSSDKTIRPLAPSILVSQRSAEKGAERGSERGATHNPIKTPQNSKSPRSPGLCNSPPQAGFAPNLDYFSFSGELSPHPSQPKSLHLPEPTMWERLLTTLQVPDEDHIYDWPPIVMPQNNGDGPIPSAGTSTESIWSPDAWTASNGDSLSVPTHPTQSLLSFTGESPASGEEYGNGEHKAESEGVFRSIMIPQYASEHASPEAGERGLADVLQAEIIS